MSTKTIVIHHSADYDGIFCREIARKFLPDAELIGWDFGNPPLENPQCDILYVMDLPLDAPFGFKWDKEVHSRRFFKGEVIWIDHHKSAIDSHPKNIPGYRIDGVAACRLAWQWFSAQATQPEFGTLEWRGCLQDKQDYIDRKVNEPLAVRLAGEWDIWDHRDPRAELFQFGLDSVVEPDWKSLLDVSLVKPMIQQSEIVAGLLCERGVAAKAVIDKRNADTMRERSFLVKFEGLKFLACNGGRGSKVFALKDKPETGHDALMSFWYDGSQWTVSLYHAEHRKDIDLSQIAVKHGGGGHRGACGFRVKQLSFIG